MKRYQAYLFDLDGTLYRGAEPMPYAADSLARLRQDGAQIRFLTNNSGVTPESVAVKLEGMGIQASPGEVLTSGTVAIEHLSKRGHRRIFVVGEPGLVSLLRERGFLVSNADDRGIVSPEGDGPVDAVLCGICRTFTYALLKAALQAILAGAEFVATNPDPTYPVEGGRLEPGAGSLVAALQTCSGVVPYVAGKPRHDMVLSALADCQVSTLESLVVGDRIDTDLAAAEAAGCPAILVLSGVTAQAPSGIEAIHDLRELLA